MKYSSVSDLGLGRNGGDVGGNQMLGLLKYRHSTQIRQLVFLSDAAIRRWCGPRWRIAASRQTRNMAVLFEHHRLAADLTVMPLITGTEYSRLVAISGGAQFASDAGTAIDRIAERRLEGQAHRERGLAAPEGDSPRSAQDSHSPPS